MGELPRDGGATNGGATPAIERQNGPVVALPRDHEAIFADALAAIAAGRSGEAQALLEGLIAMRPDQGLAAKARRELGRLYALAYPHSGAGEPPRDGEAAAAAAATSLQRGADGPDAPGPAASAAGASPGDGARPTPAFAPPPFVPPTWRGKTVRTERFEAMMRAEVGDRIFFALDSAEIGARARGVVLRQARWLTRFPDVYVVVEAHADDPGDEQRNRQLSTLRAERVRDLLIAGGIDPERIDLVPLGHGQRVAECANPLCAAQNRRAVTRLHVILPPAAVGARSRAP